MNDSRNLRAVSIYARLLRLYPETFLAEYGSEMQTVFADQYREARQSRRPFSQLGFWLRIFWDLMRSAAREHLRNEKSEAGIPAKSFLERTAEVSFVRLVLAAMLGLMLVVIGVTTLQPRLYMSMARVSIAPNAGEHDPFYMQVVFEKLRSVDAMKKAVGELITEGKFTSSATPIDDHLVPTRSMIDLRQSRNTSLIEIAAYHRDPELAAAIANKVADVFRRGHPEYRLEMVDPATPNQIPIRPNVPANLVIGSAFSLFAGIIVVSILRVIVYFRARSRRRQAGL